MLESSELAMLEMMRKDLMALDGQSAFRGADDLSAEVIDMAVIIWPLDTVIARARLNWTYGLVDQEAKIIMRRWGIEDGIQSLEQLDEVVKIMTAIKVAFPLRDWKARAHRAAVIGSVTEVRRRATLADYPAHYREEYEKILAALETP